MHRVELKVLEPLCGGPTTGLVPNAPCGVERGDGINDEEIFRCVPNAPCGVESHLVPDFHSFV